MSLKIYAFPLSPRSFKVLWAANHVGVPFELRLVDFTKNAQNDAAFLAINPNGRAPAIDDNGYVLWESNAIIEYLASLKPETGLLPQDTKARLQTTKWLYWESAHWDPACAVFAFERVVKALFNRGEPVQAEIDRGTQMFERIGKVLDGALAQHRYVAGDKLTIADIALGSSMCIADQARFPIENYRHILRWKTDLTALPSWTKTTALQVPPGRAA
jgi:glutathione S-transferase